MKQKEISDQDDIDLSENLNKILSLMYFKFKIKFKNSSKIKKEFILGFANLIMMKVLKFCIK
jgi:hypothetical protein